MLVQAPPRVFSQVSRSLEVYEVNSSNILQTGCEELANLPRVVADKQSIIPTGT